MLDMFQMCTLSRKSFNATFLVLHMEVLYLTTDIVNSLYTCVLVFVFMSLYKFVFRKVCQMLCYIPITILFLLNMLLDNVSFTILPIVSIVWLA